MQYIFSHLGYKLQKVENFWWSKNISFGWQMIGLVKSHIFDDVSKWTPRLSINFSSRTRIVFPTYMSFSGSQIPKKYILGGRCVKCFWQMSICRQTTKNKGWVNKTILVWLKKLVERRGVHFDVSSKMRDFTRPIICPLETHD